MRETLDYYIFPHLSLCDSKICEIKFSVGEFVIDQDYEAKLRKKMEIFRDATKSKKALQLVLITTYGVRQNAHSGIMQSQVRMDDLFSVI